MKFNLKLFEVRFSKFDGYGFSLLGIGLKRQDLAIGFNIRKESKYDKDEIHLSLYFYQLRIRKLINIIPKSHYICNHCNTPVHSESLYCVNCDEHMIRTEVTLIEI